MTDRAPCSSPLPWETLVAYWARDLAPDAEEAAELHLLGCAPCTAESRRIEAVARGLRAQGAAGLRVVEGGRQDAAPPERRATAPPRRRPWLYGSAAGGLALAAAALLFFLVPRGSELVSYPLPPPVRAGAALEISPPSGVRDVRLVPDLAGGPSANGARVRRVGGAWLTVRVEAGPPFAVLLSGSDLTPGRYELELVSVPSGGPEESRGFYRFTVPGR